VSLVPTIHVFTKPTGASMSPFSEVPGSNLWQVTGYTDWYIVGFSYTVEENIRIAAWVDHDSFHSYHYLLTFLESFDDKNLRMKHFRQVTCEWFDNLQAILRPWFRYAASSEGNKYLHIYTIFRSRSSLDR